jgi:hypothetical protein
MSSVTNLAKNLADTTRAHGGRVAVRVDNAAMTYRAWTRRAPGWPGCCTNAAWGLATGWGS